MKNRSILNEISEMKYLFDYKRGKVISEQYNLDEADEYGIATDATTTTTTVAGASTTTKTTRKSTGLEVQKLLNTKFSAGLKEDGVLGPLSRGAIMTALEGGSTSSGSTTATTTVAGGVGGATTTTTTVAGGTTTNTPSGGGTPKSGADVGSDF
jgi:hypothetical protein